VLRPLISDFAQINLITALGDAELKQKSGGSAVLLGGEKLKRKLSSDTADTPALAIEALDRKKSYLIDGTEGYLTLLGISDKNGRVHDKMQGKFRQIHRFLENLEVIYRALPEEGVLSVYDLCCGKSYLSFAVYHYLTAVKGRQVDMLCVDLKADVIEACKRTAAALGFFGMRFVCEDILKLKSEGDVHLVVSLHACDVATDIVLKTAVRLSARAVLSTPCCQKYLSARINQGALAFATDYGHLKRKLCDALTDGLTAGLYLRLLAALDGTAYKERISLGKAIRSIRGRKTEGEIALQTEVLKLLNQVCAELTERVRPGTTEEWVWEYCQAFMREHNLTSSWENDACPLVHAGIRANQGLVHPSATNAVQPGDVFHLSFGAKHPTGYATDFQRSWYVFEPGETEVPAEVQAAFDATIEAIDDTRRTMRPGDEGRYVNKIFNGKLAGFDASGGGHAVGRALHDGCFQLAGDSKVIGKLPEVELEVGNVFTLEVFCNTPRGVIGVEEMIRLTPDGGEYLYIPQRELWTLPCA
jgi:Xaa-Pro aminopeptidase